MSFRQERLGKKLRKNYVINKKNYVSKAIHSSFLGIDKYYVFI